MDEYTTEHRPLYEVKANLFKGLAHPVRVRVLEVLAAAQARGETVSVADLIADTGLEASHLSQHLAVLRRHQLVAGERRASQVFYRLAYPQVADFLDVSRALLVEILEHTQRQLASTISAPIPESMY
jgi:DNA-binding transcriptional ArsR family regulator